MIFIGVIGESKTSPETFKLAKEVGKEIAKARAVLVCGGLKGVMEAAAKGSKSEGGLTVGILPGGKREEANPYIDIPIVTGLGYARNKLVVKTAQVIIAVGGSYGTLTEIGFALSYNIPVIGLRTWELVRKGKKDTAIIEAKNPKDAVRSALSLIKKNKGKRYKTRTRVKVKRSKL